MPASLRESRTDAVSEVVGQILIFGILSTVLIISLLAFNAAQEGAQDRVMEARAESAAQRLAGTVVEAALFAERTNADEVSLRSVVDLPPDLEGRSYSIDLNTADVAITVGGTTLKAGLFSATAPAGVFVCNLDPFGGGPVVVVVASVPVDAGHANCPNLSAPHPALRIITLEPA